MGRKGSPGGSEELCPLDAMVVPGASSLPCWKPCLPPVETSSAPWDALSVFTEKGIESCSEEIRKDSRIQPVSALARVGVVGGDEKGDETLHISSG